MTDATLTTIKRSAVTLTLGLALTLGATACNSSSLTGPQPNAPANAPATMNMPTDDEGSGGSEERDQSVQTIVVDHGGNDHNTSDT